MSFLFIAIHAATMDPIPVYHQFIPPAECWDWHVENTKERDHRKLEESVSINNDTDLNGTDPLEEHHDDEIQYGCNWQ